MLSALRLAVSIGGDSDTLAAITGGIAEAYYGIPKDIENQALTYLPEEFQQVIWEFREKVKNNKKKLPL
ncbi:ADP-ribosylglycohydrolase family protein [Capnocytophaga granulosa]|uniref:ADP-ribosylglycohydrolase family protein n=1 Tax=Capnocytophaga granulosa TaxID=45242 RepID=UPI0028EE9C12|nr:ADP-ribosylglycohydrolase family protein [Capnocytophaga granulosa]